MKDEDFANLVESIKQAGQIKRGELSPDRTIKASGKVTRPTVLHITDTLESRDLIGRILTTIGGYELIKAETAEEGIAWAIEHHPDIILVDIDPLSNVDGSIVVANTLKSIKETSGIPLIALISPVRDNKENPLPAGYDGYILKPVNVDLLLEQVNSFLKSR